MPKSIRIEEISRFLAEFTADGDIEIPGQYVEYSEPNLEQHERLHSFGREVRVLLKHGFFCRGITMRSMEGREHQFTVHYSMPQNIRMEERINQFFRITNWWLRKHPETMRRSLELQVPVMVPLSPMVRLLEDNTSFVTLTYVYEQHCLKYGREPEQPILLTQRILSEATSENLAMAQLRAYKEVIAHLVNEHMLSLYMLRTLRDPNHLWSVKRTMLHHMAEFAFLGYILGVGDRKPDNISFCRATGVVSHSEFFPTYNQKDKWGEIDLSTTENLVAFRLTRNIQSLLAPQIVDALFADVFTCMAQCLTEPRVLLQNYFSVFTRDEYIALSQKRSRETPSDEAINGKMRANVDYIMTRLLHLSPHLSAGSGASNGGNAAVMRTANGGSANANGSAASGVPLQSSSSASMGRSEFPPDISDPIDKRARDLITQTSGIQRLCQMYVNWHPWY